MTREQLDLNIPKTDLPRVVIAGGGFGGINLARKLAKKRFQVVLLDRYNYHTFQPLLYQVATAGLEPDSVAGPLRKALKNNDRFHFRMLKMLEVDPEKQVVKTVAGDLHFDYLVIATGAKINYFNIESIEKNAFPLKQITHALDLRSHLFQQFEEALITREPQKQKEMMSVTVVGAGPTGVELCGALAELRNHVLQKDYPTLDLKQMDITLIEGMNRVLPGMSEKTSEKTCTYLEKMGVTIRLGRMTKGYDGETVTLDTGEQIRAGTLIWAAGVQGNLVKGFSENSIHRGQYLVNRMNQVIKKKEEDIHYQHIFALGDVAWMEQEGYPAGLPGVAQVAIQQGKHLGKNLSLLARGKSPVPFTYKNKGVLATVGRNKAVADLPRMRLAGFAGWFVWMLVHLLFLVGFRSKAVVFANWIWNYFTFDRGIRLILRPSSKNKNLISEEITEAMQAG